jgi:2-phospho-L-lactate/phosphoenolpyruvate guanylyltransferase
MRTVAILPVKTFGRAKQRLTGAFHDRPALAAAMVADVLETLTGIEAIDHVIVVTAEHEAADLARSAGARVVHDPVEAGQSAAALLGIAEAQADRVLLVPGDCPSLDAGEVRELLAHTEPVVIVPDRHGTGTNALLLTPPGVMAPSFGEGSFARHAALAGDALRVVEIPSLGLDVDTADDLAALRRAPGVGPRTRAVLEQAAVA